MANNAEGWLSAAAYRTGACPTLAPITEVRFRDLPPRHKRELAALVTAGVASTALMFAPLIVHIADDIALPATSLRIQLAAAPVLSPTALAQIAILPARARGARQPRVSNALLIAGRPLSAPVVQLTARADDEPAQSVRAAPRNRIVRVLFGDGRYRVRPFPSPTDRN